MNPDDVALLRQRVSALAPELALECGSGQSTQVLRESAGWVISLEHDEKWAEDTRKFVTATNGEIRRVALAEDWYQTSLPNGIGFVLIDGPPGYIGRHATFPHIIDFLAPNAVVWLDDVDRPGEREIINGWCDTYGLSWQQVGRRIGEIVVPDDRLLRPGGS